MDMVVPILIIDLAFIVFWFLINKARHSKNQTIRELDNGYVFYSSLSDESKDNYWKEDTKIVNCFLGVIFVLLQVTLLICVVVPFKMIYVYLLITTFLITFIIFVRKSLKLQKKYKGQ